MLSMGKLIGKKPKLCIKKSKKLQESCTKMMMRLIVDWEHERHQEEEAAFKRLEEARKKKTIKFCAADVRTAVDDSQRQVTKGSSSMPESATMIKKVKVEDDNNVIKQTKSSRQTQAKLKMMEKMTALKMTTKHSKYRTVAECSTTSARRVKEIAAMIDTTQPTHLPSAKQFGRKSKTIISKPSIKFCAANHSPDVPESQRAGQPANEKPELDAD
jgi:hypothetical protein